MEKLTASDLTEILDTIHRSSAAATAAAASLPVIVSHSQAEMSTTSPKNKTNALISSEAISQTVTNQLGHIVSILIKHNPLPVVDLERRVDALSLTIKRQVTADDTSQPWFSHTANVTIRLIWGYPWTPKLHKKLIKVTVEMERHAPRLIERYLEPYIKVFTNVADISIEKLGTWYSFVETSSVAQSLIGQNLRVVISLLNSQLKSLLRENHPWTVERQQWLQLLIKICLQIFQHLPKHVGQLIYHTERNEDLESLVTCMLRLLASTGIPSHCMPLAGTAVAFLFCFCPDDEQAIKIFRDIYIKLGSDDFIQFGSLVVQVTPLTGEAVSPSTDHKPYTSFGHLCLLTGLIPCVQAGMLDKRLPDETEQLFVSWLFDSVLTLCNVPERQSPSFRLLTYWYQRVAKWLPKTPIDDKNELLGHGSHVVTSTLTLVWTHLDSPVEGVNESVIEVLGLMLKVHCVEERQKVSGTSPVCRLSEWELVNELLTQTLAMSWTIKGKHSLVAALLPYLNVIEFLEREEDLFPALLNCLSTNYLTPASTTVYRTILQNLPKQSSMQCFTKFCLPWLVQGLASNSSLLRQNTCHNWLATTLKYAKQKYPVILDYLKKLESSQIERNEVDAEVRIGSLGNSSYIFHGLLAVMKAGKAQQLPISESEDIVEKAFQHQDDDIRLDAFAILCVSQKTSEPLCAWELKLLQESLPDNMTSDNASFRQCMAANVRTLLTRLRDSALSRMRTTSKQSVVLPAEVTCTLDFVQWFWALLMRNLSPGASYQRLKSSLDWVLLILDTFSYQPYRHQRKGNTPDTVGQLLAVAAARGQCDFYCTASTRLILNCLLHGTDEIRGLTAGILLNYFPWPLQLTAVSSTTPPAGGTEHQTEVAPSGDCQLLQTGLRLCNSAKPHESESGALLIKMLFQKLVVEKKQMIDFHGTENEAHTKHQISSSADRQTRTEDREFEAQEFIHQLLSLIENSLSKTRENTLNGARKTPIHGLLLAMRRCLGEAGLGYTDMSCWAPVIEKLMSIVSQVINTVLDVLGGRLHEDETAPSFEEMGKAITATIAESMGDETADNELLTHDQRLLMTWAWVNIKESSVLLGSLVECLPLATASSPGVLAPDQVMAIGDVFLKVLLQCRHRGAIEGCNLGLARFCEALLRSSNQDLHAIPKTLLTKVLSQIQRSDLTLSITRRSAGLPLIITTIITSESKTRQSVLLSHVLTTLLSIAETPVSEGDQRADMPQVHAMNILKSVLREASVAMAARQYLPRAIMIAIEGFASPHWAIQNAATQLFGVLVSRMLGQKRTQEDHVELMTMPEFFAHYPTLEEFLLRHLEAGAAEQRSATRGSLRLQPTTFPVLGILARLSSGNLAHSQTSITKFHTALTQLLGCPVYAVRELAAQSLASLTPIEQLPSRLRQAVDHLPSTNTGVQFNRLHGDVTLCCLLLSRLLPSQRRNELPIQLVESVKDKLWLASIDTSPLLHARYIELLLELAGIGGISEFPDAICKCLDQLVEDTILSNGKVVNGKVGWDQGIRQLVRWCLTHGGDASGDVTIQTLCRFLDCEDTDVVLATLEWLTQQMTDNGLTEHQWKELLVHVGTLVLSNPHCSVGAVALSLLAQIDERIDTHLHEVDIDTDRLWDHLIGIINREKNSRQAGPALYMSATLLTTHLCSQPSRLEVWCCLLAACCGPQNAEWLHLYGAKAITILAAPIAEQLKKDENNPTLQRLALWMFNAGVRLLVSEHPPVRQEAACFVSQLQSHVTGISGKQPLHTALALTALCDVTFSLLGRTPLLFHEVVNIFRKENGPSLSDIISQESKEYVDDVFEAEDLNYYRENVMLAETLCSCFQRHLPADAIESEFYNALLSSIFVNLEEALTSLCSLCSGMGPVNVSCSPRVYEAVWSDLQMLTVLVTTPYGVRRSPHNQQHTDRRLGDLLLQYAQIPFLHPHLQKTAFCIANKIQPT